MVDLATWESPKSQFSTGFIRVFDMVKCHVRFIYKRNAFLIILEAFLRLPLGNHQFYTGFIRVFATRFWFLRNLVFRWFYKVFDLAECHVLFIYKRNAF